MPASGANAALGQATGRIWLATGLCEGPCIIFFFPPTVQLTRAEEFLFFFSFFYRGVEGERLTAVIAITHLPQRLPLLIRWAHLRRLGGTSGLLSSTI